jgi:hypothetical protein
MTTARIKPEQVELGDRVLVGDQTWIVKSFESDYNRAYDFYLQNETGYTHQVFTDSVTIVM